MSDLPSYSGPLALCTKCGARDASTAYYDESGTLSGEYHERMCKRCGYLWYEAVLDEQG